MHNHSKFFFTHHDILHEKNSHHFRYYRMCISTPPPPMPEFLGLSELYFNFNHLWAMVHSSKDHQTVHFAFFTFLGISILPCLPGTQGFSTCRQSLPFCLNFWAWPRKWRFLGTVHLLILSKGKDWTYFDSNSAISLPYELIMYPKA